MTSIGSRTVAASPTQPWPADRVELWPIERPTPYANNPRLHSAVDIERDRRLHPDMGVHQPDPGGRTRRADRLSRQDAAAAKLGLMHPAARYRHERRLAGGNVIAIGSDRPRSESSHPPASVRSLW